jgi:hypothetical protein
MKQSAAIEIVSEALRRFQFERKKIRFRCSATGNVDEENASYGLMTGFLIDNVKLAVGRTKIFFGFVII